MLKKASLLASVLVLLTLVLGGCNTMRGVGKDIHDSAQNVQIAIEGSETNSRQLDNSYGYDRPRPDARVQR